MAAQIWFGSNGYRNVGARHTDMPEPAAIQNGSACLPDEVVTPVAQPACFIDGRRKQSHASLMGVESRALMLPLLLCQSAEGCILYAVPSAAVLVFMSSTSLHFKASNACSDSKPPTDSQQLCATDSDQLPYHKQAESASADLSDPCYIDSELVEQQWLHRSGLAAVAPQIFVCRARHTEPAALKMAAHACQMQVIAPDAQCPSTDGCVRILQPSTAVSVSM